MFRLQTSMKTAIISGMTQILILRRVNGTRLKLMDLPIPAQTLRFVETEKRPTSRLLFFNKPLLFLAILNVRVLPWAEWSLSARAVAIQNNQELYLLIQNKQDACSTGRLLEPGTTTTLRDGPIPIANTFITKTLPIIKSR